MLRHFQFLKTRFTLKAIDELLLPEYKGSALRGGFGHLLKEVCCTTRETPCKECSKRDGCLYSYLFETYCPDDSQFIRSFHEIPRPYILEPDISSQRRYLPGDIMTFDLLLFGRAIEYFPYFLVLYHSYGEELGIGFKRGRFSIEQVATVDIQDRDKDVIYTHNQGFNSELIPHAILCFEDIKKWRIGHIASTHEITLDFLTPLDIRKEGSALTALDFVHFIKSLIRTISNLAYFHGGEMLDINYQDFYQKASLDVQIKEMNLATVHLARYSNKQKKKIPISGLTGRITFCGNLSQYLDYIVLGQWTHLGRGRVMGLGRYRLIQR